MIQFSLLALTLGCAGSTLAFAPASRVLPSLRAASATSPHALRSAGTFISAQQERPRLSLKGGPYNLLAQQELGAVRARVEGPGDLCDFSSLLHAIDATPCTD